MLKNALKVFAALLALAPAAALGQSSVLQGGHWAQGHAPMYVGQGSGQPVVQDSGPAGGGVAGVGLAELGITARGTGSAPYIGQGTGPGGTNACDYDGPTTGPYHYLCWSANPGGFIFGYGGGASPNPFSLTINGNVFSFPSAPGNIVTTIVPTTNGAPVCFIGTTGQVTTCPTTGNAATFSGNPTASSAGGNVNFTVQGLPARGAPDANNDLIVLYNNATGAFNYVTPGQIASSATAGVSSLCGLTGAVSATQATACLNPFSSMLQGSVPASGGGTINFLRADGNWGVPPSSVTPPGGTSGQQQFNNSGAFGGFTQSGDVQVNTTTGVSTIQPSVVSNTKLAAGAANTIKGSLNGTTTSDLAVASCSAIYSVTQWLTGIGWQCGINPVISTRAAAAALNLSAYSVVTTQGYATAGDGGDATFQKVGSTQYQDVSIAAGSITSAGSGCTNGTYYGVSLTGGTGNLAMATVVAASTIVSTVTITYAGSQYSVGDVLSGSITGCTFTWTVATITMPTGSFADTSGAHWQIVMPARGIDMRAFGVKFDWTVSGADAGATDNFTTITNVYLFAGAQSGGGVFATGGTTGGRVIMPRGMAMYCGSNGAKVLSQPFGVTVQGQGDQSSGLKPCDAWGTSTNMYELCNSQSHLTCFGTMFESAQIYVSPFHDAGANVVNLAVVYTNNCQQENCGIRNAVIFTGACRVGYKLEIGYGGASLVTAADGVSILGGEKAANCATNIAPEMSINYGTTSVIVDKLTLGGLSPASGGNRDDGIAVSGGFVEVRQLTAEQVVSPLIVNINTSGGLAAGMVTLRNAFGDAGCGWLVTLSSVNQPGNFLISGPMALNSCSLGIVENGQSGGSNMTVPQVSDKIFNP